MQRCTSCARAGDDIGTCGSHKTCGQAVEIDPKKDIVIRCNACDKTRAFSIPRLVHGKSIALEMSCPRGEETCQARQVVLKGNA